MFAPRRICIDTDSPPAILYRYRSAGGGANFRPADLYCGTGTMPEEVRRWKAHWGATYQIFKYYYYGLGYQSRNRTLTINRNLNINRNRNPEIDPNPIPNRKNNRNVCSTNDTGIKLNIRVISKLFSFGRGWVYKRPTPEGKCRRYTPSVE